MPTTELTIIVIKPIDNFLNILNPFTPVPFTARYNISYRNKLLLYSLHSFFSEFSLGRKLTPSGNRACDPVYRFDRCRIRNPHMSCRGEKILVFHKKRRKGFRKLNGHRQDLTNVVVKEIVIA